MSKQMKKHVIQIFDSGSVTVRGKDRPLRLVFWIDPITGVVQKVQKTKATFGKSHKISRNEYYSYVRKYLPRSPMTEEERKRAHVKSVQEHRKRKKNAA